MHAAIFAATALFFAAAKPPVVLPPPADLAAVLKPLKFREIGPAVMGGRIDDVAVVESDPDVVYVATASGGVMKTTNGGTTWEPVFDDQTSSSIGAIAVAPSDPSIVWVGTGEANNRQSSSWGNGVYRSTDGGKTWQHLGLAETHHIGRIVVHPTDPNVVWVAAAGKLWGPSKERGVYKTTDGGATWKNVLFINEDTGVSDIAVDPVSPGTAIAAAYQRRRTVFGYSGSGPGGGLYKTTDGGATWKKLEKGLPWDPNARPTTPPTDPEAMKQIGRIGVAIYRRDPSVVYALVEHVNGGTFRSDDKGESWTKMSDTNPRASYYSQIRIDPNNDQRLWVMGANMFNSDDGGKTFRQNLVQRIHGDHHALWIDPRDSNNMVLGSDGGIHFSRDRGRTWDFTNNVPLGQFYEIGLDMQKPYRVCGGLQDNNSWCGPSMSFDPRGIGNGEWFTVGGGDGFYAQIDPTDPNIVYVESQDGNLSRRDLRTHEARNIRPPAPEGERYRFQWNSPVVISAFDPKTIYYAGNFVFRSPDRGDSWTRISPDLTNGGDRDKLPIMGRVPDRFTLSRHDGVQAFPAITTISESPLNRDLLWAGTDDGNLQVTRDGGKSWKNVAEKLKGLPKGTYVSRVVASRHNEGTAYATFDGHRGNDFNVYVFTTSDYGETWKAIRNGFPDDGGVVNVIREHHRNPKLLFAGTEHGLFASLDQGARWQRVKMNLPTVPVDDIAIHPRDNDLVLGTHGRSIWILDDLTPFEQVSDAVLASDFHLFDLRPATSWRLQGRSGSTGHKVFVGENPPNGALIHYYLKAKPDEKERVRIVISDKDGKVLRELDGGKEPGINRVVWNFRTRSVTAPPTRAQLAAAGNVPGGETAAAEAAVSGAEPAETPQFGGGGGFGQQPAPRVEPGEYTVKVSVGKNEQTKTVTVVDDPRLTATAEDRAARRAAMTQLAQMAGTAAATQRSLTGLRTALNTEIENWRRPGAAKPSAEIQKRAEELLKKVDDSCKRFASATQCGERAAALGAAGPALVYIPPNITQRITQLLSAMDNYVAAPTAWQLDQIKLLQGMLAEQAAAARKLTVDELAALNKMMNDAAVPHIVIPPQRGTGGES
jgi:photosystem II stability/assembly factor-like uncharacterized protein